MSSLSEARKAAFWEDLIWKKRKTSAFLGSPELGSVSECVEYGEGEGGREKKERERKMGMGMEMRSYMMSAWMLSRFRAGGVAIGVWAAMMNDKRGVCGCSPSMLCFLVLQFFSVGLYYEDQQSRARGNDLYLTTYLTYSVTSRPFLVHSAHSVQQAARRRVREAELANPEEASGLRHQASGTTSTFYSQLI